MARRGTGRLLRTRRRRVPRGNTPGLAVSHRKFAVLNVSFSRTVFATRREERRVWAWLTRRAWFEHVNFGSTGFLGLIVPVAAAGVAGAPALVRLAYQRARTEGCALLLFCQREDGGG